MFNLLIVDDEHIILEDLRSGIDWKGLNIDNVYTAANISAAKEIFHNQPVSILICDIEMPLGNGLELLSWVRENYPQTETIILTCHADFNYAVEAIRKGSFDYLLKPVAYEDLEKVLIKAIKKANDELSLVEHNRIGSYWTKHQPMIVERFWLDIVNRNVPSTIEAIMETANERNIPFSEKMTFMLVFIKVRRCHKMLDLHDEKRMDFTLKNIIEETVLKTGENGMVLQNGKGNYFVVLSRNSNDNINLERIENDCQQMLRSCSVNLECDLNCYIGEAVHVQDVSDQAEKLILLEKQNIAFENSVFCLNHYTYKAKEYLTPDFIIWNAMLVNGETEVAYASICSHIDAVLLSTGLDSEALKKFQIDFSQMFYSVLKQKNIQAHKVLSDDKSAEMYALATRSITDLKTWIRHIFGKLTECSCKTDNSESIVERAKTFIKQNIDQDISRTDVATFLHINPDYLTRIFGKDVGMSIPEFIMHERLKVAKEMIRLTDMSISDIAVSVGYTNFSYFSKLFKEMFGIKPTALKACKGRATEL